MKTETKEDWIDEIKSKHRTFEELDTVQKVIALLQGNIEGMFNPDGTYDDLATFTIGLLEGEINIEKRNIS